MRALDQLCESYLDLGRHFDPAAASAAGFVSADPRLGEFHGEAMRQHVAAFRALAGAVEELEVVALEDEIDRTALLETIRVGVDRLEQERPHVRDPGFWLLHLVQALAALLLRSEGDPAERAYAAAQRIGAIPAFLDQARATLRRPPAILVDEALTLLGPVGELLLETARQLGPDAPGGAEALTPVLGAALEALARFGAALRDRIEPDPDLRSFALGEERLERRLHHEYAIAAGAAELWRYAAKLAEEVEAELTRRAVGMAPGRPWRELVLELEQAGVGDVPRAYDEEMARARGFLRERDVVPLPDRSLPVVETPPWLRFLIPAAARQPGPPLPLTSEPRLWVTPGAQSRFAIPLVAAHEVVPGREVQLAPAAGASSLVRRELHSRVATEGWALYAEGLMAEIGFFRDPEVELLRLARLLGAAVGLALDLGLHARGMTPVEGVALLTARLPIARRTAEAEVRRACVRPGRSLAAAAGRRDLLALRARFGAGPEAAVALRDFHATLFRYGALPPGLAGWGMGLTG
jgi:hypothetical protein